MINKYFNSQSGVASEQNLIQNLTTEIIQQSGIECNYIPRSLNMDNMDNILNEAPISSFDTYYSIEMMVDMVDGFQGDNEMLTKFGLIISDETSVTISASRFIEITSMQHPVEGDLVYVPLSKTLFEITHVPDESNFLPLNSTPSFEIKLKAFQYSEEVMDTGIVDIDTLDVDLTAADHYSDNDILEIENAGITNFSVEDPFQGF